MAKLNTSDLSNLQIEASAVSSINSNFAAVETALENTLSRDGTSPNSMGASLDMNSNRILNLPAAIGPTEPLRAQDLADFVGGGLTIPSGLATSSTDNAIVRFNGTGGGTQNSAPLISDAGAIQMNGGSGTSNVLYFPTGFVNSSLFVGNGGSHLLHTGALEGYYNTSVGMTSLVECTTGSYNTCVGFETLQFTTTGSYNSAFGEACLIYSTTGNGNTAVGWKACLGTVGVGHSDYNTGVGYATLWTSANGTPVTQNTAIGAFALSAAGLVGARNCALGYLAGGSTLTSANDNIFVGYNSGGGLTTGDNNIFVGQSAGASVTTGSNNVIIGAATGSAALSGNIILSNGAGTTFLTLNSTNATFTVPIDSATLSTKLIKGRYVLGASAATGMSITGTTTETTLATISVPANTMGANGQIVVTTQWSFAGAAGTRTPRIKFAGTVYNGIAFTSAALSARTQAQWANRNATNSQVGTEPSQANFSQNNTAVSSTSAIDTTSSQNITITAQLGNAADTMTLESYIVELIAS